MAMSNRAEEILKAAAHSQQGLIFVSRDATYQTVLIDNKDYVRKQTAEEIAEAKAAVRELERMGYLESSIAEWVYTLTSKGYEAAHLTKPHQLLRNP
jgi:PHD/YefM family antitoxin component YafN of YafNO toxin-antitoxin module